MPGVNHLGQNTWVESLIEDRESSAAVPAPDGQLPSGEKGLHTTGRQTRLGPFNAISTAAVGMPAILGIVRGTTLGINRECLTLRERKRLHRNRGVSAENQ